MVTLEQFRYCPTHSTHPPFCYDSVSYTHLTLPTN